MNYQQYEQIRARVYEEVTGCKFIPDGEDDIYYKILDEQSATTEDAERFFRQKYMRIKKEWEGIKTGRVKIDLKRWMKLD